MLDKYIDPPCDIWEEREDLEWIDDLYEEWSGQDQDTALYNYECQVYNELDRRIVV